MAVIRTAREADAEAMLAIYAPYVRDTAISFETEPPSVEEFRGRMRSTLEAGLWLVCEADDGSIGYACAARLSMDGRGDGLRAPRSSPAGRRPGSLHVTARLPGAPGLPHRGRRHRATESRQRGPSRADGFRARRGPPGGGLQAWTLARR